MIIWKTTFVMIRINIFIENSFLFIFFWGDDVSYWKDRIVCKSCSAFRVAFQLIWVENSWWCQLESESLIIVTHLLETRVFSAWVRQKGVDHQTLHTQMECGTINIQTPAMTDLLSLSSVSRNPLNVNHYICLLQCYSEEICKYI